MHKIALTLALLGGSWRTALAQQPPQRTITVEEIIADISQFRRLILQDSTPIDFCDLPGAYTEQGNLRRRPGDELPVPMPRYATLAECRSAPKFKTGPVIKRMEIRGDTVAVIGYTRRGSIGFEETFVYTPAPNPRSPESRYGRRYMIGAIIYD